MGNTGDDYHYGTVSDDNRRLRQQVALLRDALTEARPFVEMAAVSQRNFLDRLFHPPDDLKAGCADLFRKLEKVDHALAEAKR